MATLQIPIFGPGTRMFSTTVAGFKMSPSQSVFSDGTADELMVEFGIPTARHILYGSFEVPDNYSVSTTDPAIIIPWAVNSTQTNDVEWDFDYYAIGVGEDVDPVSFTEEANNNDTGSGTIKEIQYAVVTLTRANIAALDIIRFGLARDGDDAGDTFSVTVYCFFGDVMFRYDDA